MHVKPFECRRQARRDLARSCNDLGEIIAKYFLDPFESSEFAARRKVVELLAIGSDVIESGLRAQKFELFEIGFKKPCCRGAQADSRAPPAAAGFAGLDDRHAGADPRADSFLADAEQRRKFVEVANIVVFCAQRTDPRAV